MENNGQNGEDALFAESEIEPTREFKPTLSVFVPAGVLYYESLNDIPHNNDRASGRGLPKNAKFHHIETDEYRFLPIKEVNPDDPNDKNKEEIEGRGLYVRVQLGDQLYWIRYNTPPRKGEKRPYYSFA